MWNTTWNYAYPIFYRVLGQTITFIPSPPNAYNIQLNYIPTAPVLVADTDSLDSINSWDELIVLWATQKDFTKEENGDGCGGGSGVCRRRYCRPHSAGDDPDIGAV